MAIWATPPPFPTKAGAATVRTTGFSSDGATRSRDQAEAVGACSPDAFPFADFCVGNSPTPPQVTFQVQGCVATVGSRIPRSLFARVRPIVPIYVAHIAVPFPILSLPLPFPR
jgi:hypothetical protein